MMKQIDLNCDLGEGGGFDDQLMPFISTCNIACGGHYGNAETIAETVESALKHDVKVGAHPSYPDKTHFGRQSMAISTEALKDTLYNQIMAVKTCVESRGGKLHHVKPHGALYNALVYDKEKAEAVIEVVGKIDEDLIFFVPPKSMVEKLAQGKLTTWIEGFADRNYNPDFSLVSRQKPHAVLTKKEAVFQRVFEVIYEGKISLKNGSNLDVNFDTICLHSDTGNSVEILRYLTAELRKKNVKIV